MKGTEKRKGGDNHRSDMEVKRRRWPNGVAMEGFARLIEWMGYEAWSGRGYKGSKDVLHFSGPSKPWRRNFCRNVPRRNIDSPKEGDFAQGSFEIHEEVSRFRDEIVRLIVLVTLEQNLIFDALNEPEKFFISQNYVEKKVESDIPLVERRLF